ncbi:hypothetical protein [Streptomyces sp. NPDC058424]|uniref:hypothetical protein n=1 Tax=Streptomyces sp. NPDC058424 TaxID=3346491 RepID=UPI00365E88B9
MTAHDRPHRLIDEATDIVATAGGVTRDWARAVRRAMAAHGHGEEQHIAGLLVERAASVQAPSSLVRASTATGEMAAVDAYDTARVVRGIAGDPLAPPAGT